MTSTVQVANSQVLWINILLFPALPFNADQEAFERQSLNHLMDVFALRVYEAAQGGSTDPRGVAPTR
jgi:hypothetical protein